MKTATIIKTIGWLIIIFLIIDPFNYFPRDPHNTDMAKVGVIIWGDSLQKRIGRPLKTLTHDDFMELRKDSINKKILDIMVSLCHKIDSLEAEPL